MFGLFKSKKAPLIADADQRVIVAAIKAAERSTSGEVRVYVESRCSYVDPMDRAKEVFFKLKMERTEAHNAVLIYVALTDRQMALYGDEGIFKKTGGDPYWKYELSLMRRFFQEGRVADGIASCAINIGKALATHFPHSGDDKNELPDDIVFGH
ncbi:TPM domain-containing protein [Taibaiella koreensis]|uniref:TPM domain-containing protein n=1 Tax=Taibaiella koreensis TaxID=1268548 RepID=UPI000E59A155|nr:TPM domain-containing protein [Taibaiella koreensis]